MTLRKHKTVYRARLTCGHVALLRDSPMSERVRYGCTTGLGCGYNLPWVEWWRVDIPAAGGKNSTYSDVSDGEGDG